MKVRLCSDTLNVDSDDVLELARLVFDTYKYVAEKIENFYTTCFFNDKNRKVVLHCCYSKITKIRVEKLDEEGD